MGTNSKMSDVLAAIGVEQVKKIDALISKRIELAANYDKLIAEVDLLKTPAKKKNPSTPIKLMPFTSRRKKQGTRLLKT